MSENTVDDEENGTSFTMRMILSGVRSKFPTVVQLSSEKMYSWWFQQEEQQEEGDDKTTKHLNSEANNTKLIILDTRSEKEFRVSHLKNAIRVDPDLEEVTPLLRDIIASNSNEKDLSIVSYCSLGYRSTRMTERLSKTYAKIKRGDRDIPSIEFYNLEGSIFKWANGDRPLVDNNDKPTIYVHPYSVVWGMLLNKPLRKSSV